MSKRTPSFQFPKSWLNPVLHPVRRVLDKMLSRTTSLQQHIVICGFPRSGTTLVQLMIEGCVSGIRTFGKERRALEIARYGRHRFPRVVTKRPKDLFLIPEIHDFYAASSTDVRFIIVSRDPRSILTSYHFSRPSEYYVSPEYWRYLYSHWKWALALPDVISIRYEDLICTPESVEVQLAQFTGWSNTRPFRTFSEAVPIHFDRRALNGLRPLDPAGVNRWRDEIHRPRLRSLVADELPELPQMLIDMGYERSDDWTKDCL